MQSYIRIKAVLSIFFECLSIRESMFISYHLSASSPTTLSINPNSFVGATYDNICTLTIISYSKSAAFQSFCWIQFRINYTRYLSLKQPSRGLLWKRCSENMQLIYRRTPMPNCDFNTVAKHLCRVSSVQLHDLIYIFYVKPMLLTNIGKMNSQDLIFRDFWSGCYLTIFTTITIERNVFLTSLKASLFTFADVLQARLLFFITTFLEQW